MHKLHYWGNFHDQKNYLLAMVSRATMSDVNPNYPIISIAHEFMKEMYPKFQKRGPSEEETLVAEKLYVIVLRQVRP